AGQAEADGGESGNGGSVVSVWMLTPLQPPWRPPGRRSIIAPALGIAAVGLAALAVFALPSLLASEPAPGRTTEAYSDYDVYDFQTGAATIVDGSPFAANARLVHVLGSQVRVYQYPDSASRERDSATIAMNGWSVNNTPVEWTAQPHIWVRGSVVVVYLGSAPEVVREITRRVDADPILPATARELGARIGDHAQRLQVAGL
ncbi:MAG: hypothetical protein MUP76_04335, partial [Acidimicrobiia bacterium]|nr:hypothetical protein [Acidimicrobiia bacterium]